MDLNEGERMNLEGFQGKFCVIFFKEFRGKIG